MKAKERTAKLGTSGRRVVDSSGDETTPSMTDKRQTGGFQSSYRNHDQAPANGIEDAPGRGVVGTERYNVGDQPEVQGITNGRFGKEEPAGLGQSLDGVTGKVGSKRKGVGLTKLVEGIDEECQAC